MLDFFLLTFVEATFTTTGSFFFLGSGGAGAGVEVVFGLLRTMGSGFLRFKKMLGSLGFLFLTGLGGCFATGGGCVVLGDSGG